MPEPQEAVVDANVPLANDQSDISSNQDDAQRATVADDSTESDDGSKREEPRSDETHDHGLKGKQLLETSK